MRWEAPVRVGQEGTAHSGIPTGIANNQLADGIRPRDCHRSRNQTLSGRASISGEAHAESFTVDKASFPKNNIGDPAEPASPLGLIHRFLIWAPKDSPQTTVLCASK